MFKIWANILEDNVILYVKPKLGVMASKHKSYRAQMDKHNKPGLGQTWMWMWQFKQSAVWYSMLLKDTDRNRVETYGNNTHSYTENTVFMVC